jgi:DNA invertase Pin-like site-specific DNA recombinase
LKITLKIKEEYGNKLKPALKNDTGLEAARARGKKGGRRHKLDARKRALAVDLYRQKKHKVEEICAMVDITKPTLYAYVREAEREGT